MVRPVQLLSKIILLILLITACNHRRNADIIVSASNLTFVNNIAQYKGVAFTGKAFKLYENNRDTLFTRNYLRGKKMRFGKSFTFPETLKKGANIKTVKRMVNISDIMKGKLKPLSTIF